MMFTRRILEENGIFASFFLSTDKVPELRPHGNYSYFSTYIQSIKDQEHDIGLQLPSAASNQSLSIDDISAQLKRASKILYGYVQVSPKFLLVPDVDRETLHKIQKAATQLGMITVKPNFDFNRKTDLNNIAAFLKAFGAKTGVIVSNSNSAIKYFSVDGYNKEEFLSYIQKLVKKGIGYFRSLGIRFCHINEYFLGTHN
jgi:hypothetical protein